MLCGKSKWKVRRSQLGDWEAWNHNAWESTYFDTWQEAMDHADKQARTREIVLPRVGYGDYVIADKGLYSLHVEYVQHMTSIYLGGWEGAHIPNSQLWDLAMYLAACATHWEAHQ
nr:MAG TPA: hypothetical protein [Caudoviricetes sp.]